MTRPQQQVDLDAAVRAVTARRDAAQRARVRAEADRDAAQAAVERVREQLRTEFGVDTIDAARAKLAELETTLTEQIAALSAALDETGVTP